MNQVEKKNNFILQFRWLMAGAVALAAWLVINPALDRRSGLGLDLTKVSSDVILSLEDVSHRYDFFDKKDSQDLCPGASCPLNPGVTKNSLRYERKVSSNLSTLITAEGWRRLLYIAWDVPVPKFVKRKNDQVAFDFYGISGKTWKFFVNGQLVANGVGSTQTNPIIFGAPDNPEQPMTIGFEIDVGRALAPGIVHIAQVFLSQPETASKFRQAYRGLDKASILPTATGFALVAMMAALGCFFTPFFREILAFSIYVTAFNWRLLIVNDMVPFPTLLNVDFVTFDAMLRSVLLSSMWAFWALYFRVTSGLKWFPVAFYGVIAVLCYLAGRTGIGLGALVYYVKTIDIHQSIVFAGACAYAVQTWKATRNVPWAKFRANTAFLIIALTGIISACFFARFTISYGEMTWDKFRVYEPVYFFANYAVRTFILGQGMLIALEWALIVRDRQKVLQRFGTIVDPRMVHDILRGKEKSSRRVENVVALFVDLRSFTKICDVYPAEVATRTLNSYLEIVTQVVQSRDGVIDKFVGDAVLATWGVPAAGLNDPTNALRAALDIRLAIQRLNERRIANSDFPIQVGMGLHIGDVIFGAIGSGSRVDHTVIGSTINIASRIQALTKQYGCDILITRQLHERVKDCCLADNLGSAEIRGMSRPIEVVKVIGATMDNSKEVVIGDEILENAIKTRKPGLVSNSPSNLVIFEHSKSTNDKTDAVIHGDKAA